MTQHARVSRKGRTVTVSSNGPGGTLLDIPINVLVTHEDEGGRISSRLGLSMSVADATTLRNGLNLAIDKVAADEADKDARQTVADIEAVLRGSYFNNAGKVQRVREIIRNRDLQGAL